MPPPLPRNPQTTDAEHLKLLVIFHFIAAGMALLGVLIFLLNFRMFGAFMNNPVLQHQRQPPPREFFEIFKVIYIVFGIWSGVSFVLNLLSAFCLRARTHRFFSLTVAAINCLHIPLGTALGVFTIIVLGRPTVREVYDAQPR